MFDPSFFATFSVFRSLTKPAFILSDFVYSLEVLLATDRYRCTQMAGAKIKGPLAAMLRIHLRMLVCLCLVKHPPAGGREDQLIGSDLACRHHE